jgi:FkbM family methyltransferase
MKFIKKILPFKYKRSIKEGLGVPSLHWSLQNLKKKKFNPLSVLDVGAYEGYWTLDLLEVFPDARVLMVEAQASKKQFLERIKLEFKGCDYSISLLSSVDGVEKYFCENETASSITDIPVTGFNTQTIRTRSLDSLLQEKQFPLPDLIKLDVQGHELEVLKGATSALAHTEICLLEITLIDFGEGNPLLLDMINFMDTCGFQAYDISHFIRRPYDKALYQIDMFFIKKNSTMLAEKRWS